MAASQASELLKFNKDITKFSAAIGVNVTVVTRKIALDIFASIIRRTPADTGRARASWNINAGSADLSVSPSVKKGGKVPLTDKGGSLGIVAAFSSIFITNNLVYITFLEEGSSTQAPAGMVKVALEEATSFLSKAVRGL